MPHRACARELNGLVILTVGIQCHYNSRIHTSSTGHNPALQIEYCYVAVSCHSLVNVSVLHPPHSHLLHPAAAFAMQPCSHALVKLRSFDHSCLDSASIPWRPVMRFDRPNNPTLQPKPHLHIIPVYQATYPIRTGPAITLSERWWCCNHDHPYTVA